MIEKSDLDELISLIEGALDSVADVESQAAVWADESAVEDLESLANSAYSEVEDVLVLLRNIRKALE